MKDYFDKFEIIALTLGGTAATILWVVLLVKLFTFKQIIGSFGILAVIVLYMGIRSSVMSKKRIRG